MLLASTSNIATMFIYHFVFTNQYTHQTFNQDPTSACNFGQEGGFLSGRSLHPLWNRPPGTARIAPWASVWGGVAGGSGGATGVAGGRSGGRRRSATTPLYTMTPGMLWEGGRDLGLHLGPVCCVNVGLGYWDLTWIRG